MFGFRVKVDQSQFRKGLNDIQMQHYPFALAKTLTDLAIGGARVGKAQTRKAFRLHTDFIPSQILITPARKADFKTKTIKSEVRTTEKIAFMTVHDEGGIRRPKGRSISIPSELAKKVPDFKTGTGAVRGKYKPKTLLKQWNDKTRGGVKPTGSGVKAYIAAGMIFARIRNKWMTGQGKSIPFFGFEGNVRIKPEWHLRQVVTARTMEWAAPTFTKNMNAAMLQVKQ